MRSTKFRILPVSAILFLLVVLSLTTSSATTICGPKSDDLLIHICGSEDEVCKVLDVGIIDINDYPLTKAWIDKWSANPNVQLCPYTELIMVEFDLYNGRWPTGCPAHHMQDEYFDACARCRAAREFRKAIAYLMNKEKYISDFLKGYGFRLDFPLLPFQTPYLPDLGTWAKYDYDPEKADTMLYNAGFRDYDDDGMREWKNVYYPVKDWWKDNTGDTYEELPSVKTWVRMDDPNSKAAGEDLATELINHKIPVELHVDDRVLCYKNVMVLYNYNIYTGDHKLDLIPDTYYDLYSSYNYYYSWGWSPNYVGFCNSTFDYWATKVKYPHNESEAINAAKQCGIIVSQSVPAVWLWSSAATKAYKADWSGVVNNRGYGIDNYLTFCRMNSATDKTIDWGFKNNIDQLNRISSQWFWNDKVLNLIYESMVEANPFTLKPDLPLIAENWTIGTWYNSEISDNATELTFTIRTTGTCGCSRPTFHNITSGIRRNVTAYDVEFSIDFAEIIRPKTYFSLPLYVHSTWVEAPPNEMKLHVRLNQKNIFALDWIGKIPVINKDLWNKIPDTEGDTCDWQPGVALIYNYNWNKISALEYNPMVDDVNDNSIPDLKEDGTGQWMFDNYVVNTYLHLIADHAHYLCSDYIENYIKTAFHNTYGDINKNEVVDSCDLGAITRALGTVGDPSSAPIWPPIWNIYITRHVIWTKTAMWTAQI